MKDLLTKIIVLATACALLFYFGFLVGRLVQTIYFTPAFSFLGVREITSYNAVRKQCDSTPDIGAGGRVARNGVPTGYWAACNWLPFGTRIKIPAISKDLIWTVKDRMARKYGHRIDLLYPLGQSLPGGLRREEFFIAKD